MNELGVVKYGDREIAYTIEFCCRKTLEISVMPDCVVQVRAPQGVSFEAVAQKVQKKASAPRMCGSTASTCLRDTNISPRPNRCVWSIVSLSAIGGTTAKRLS